MTATQDGKRVIAGTLAWAGDGEGYGAELTTAPTFGCVQFRRKEIPAESVRLP